MYQVQLITYEISVLLQYLICKMKHGSYFNEKTLIKISMTVIHAQFLNNLKYMYIIPT